MVLQLEKANWNRRGQSRSLVYSTLQQLRQLVSRFDRRMTPAPNTQSESSTRSRGARTRLRCSMLRWQRNSHCRRAQHRTTSAAPSLLSWNRIPMPATTPLTSKRTASSADRAHMLPFPKLNLRNSLPVRCRDRIQQRQGDSRKLLMIGTKPSEVPDLRPQRTSECIASGGETHQRRFRILRNSGR